MNYLLKPETPIANPKIFVVPLEDETQAIIVPVKKVRLSPREPVASQLNRNGFLFRFKNKGKQFGFHLKPWHPEQLVSAQEALAGKLKEVGGLWIPVEKDGRIALAHFFWPRNFRKPFIRPRLDLDPYTTGSYAFSVA